MTDGEKIASLVKIVGAIVGSGMRNTGGDRFECRYCGAVDFSDSSIDFDHEADCPVTLLLLLEREAPDAR